MNVRGKFFLVTGGTGFIGSALIRGLVATGACVRSFDSNARGSVDALSDVAQHVEVVTGDIRDAGAVARATEGVDAVCHLAYVNGTEFFYSMPELVLEVAVKGIMNVIDACVLHGVPELIVASSSEVYQSPPAVPTDERVPLVIPDVLNPRFSYGGGKIISELLAINFGRSHLDRVVVFRPHNLYGPRMGWEHVIPQFTVRMSALCREQPDGVITLPIQGTGKETRSFVYIDDAVDGILRVINRGQHLGVYNVGTDVETSIEDLAKGVGRCFGRDIQIAAGPPMAGSPVRRCPDIAKLRGLGFAPRVSLSEGLAKTVAWYERYADLRPRTP